MLKRVRLTGKEKVDIINAYVEQLTPMVILSEQHGVSRQAVYKLLRKAGVDTHKGKIAVTCAACGQELARTKARVRKQLHHFCDTDCYYAFLQAGNGFPYIQNRQGQRVARTVVAKWFQLAESHIVHHEDRNDFNNDPGNLRVFANQGDHIRHHRGFDVEPIWDGRYLVI